MLTALLFLLAADPAPADVRAKFDAERRGVPAADAAVADAAAARAKTAFDAGDFNAAARLYRDARWALPARPAGLPPHVGRILGGVRVRHSDRVNSMVYSPDGAKLVTASRDGTARVWDLGNGRELLSYRGHAAPGKVTPEKPAEPSAALRVAAVAWQPKQTRVATSGGNEVHLWDADTGKLVRKFVKHTAPIKAVAFSPDGKFLATGGDDKLVILWDAETGKDLYTSQPLKARVEAAAWHPNGKYAAALDLDGTLSLHAVAAAAEKKAAPGSPGTEGNGNAGYGIAFTADGSKVLVGGADKVARFLTAPADAAAAGSPPAAVQRFAGHTGVVTAVGTAPDGKLVISASLDRTVRVWDGTSGKLTRLFQGHLEGVTALAVRPDGKQAATGADDGGIKLWELAATDDHRPLPDAADAVWAAAYNPDGSKFAAAGADTAVRVYDSRGKLLHTLTGHSRAVTSVAFSDADTLVTGGGDKVLKVWDTKAGRFVKDLPGHTSAVLALATDGKRIVSGSADRTVRGWDPAAAKEVWKFDAKSAVAAVAVRKDGQRVAVGTADGTLTILNTSGSTPTPTATVAAHLAGVAAAAFSPDGGRLATAGGDGLVKIWSVPESGPVTLAARLESQLKAGATNAVAAVSAVNFSPDGKQVVSGGADGVVRVWDAATGAEVRGLRGHTEWVTAVQFRPDGEAVLSAAVDKVVRLFDVARAADTARAGHRQAVKSLAVSPDGTVIASGSEDKSVMLWDAATGAELATIPGFTKAPNTLSFSGPQTLLIDETDTAEPKIGAYKVPGGQPGPKTSTGEVYTVQGTGAGKGVAWVLTKVGEDDFVRLGDPASPALEKDRKQKVKCAAFSADGTVAVAGDEMGVFRTWDVEKRKQVGEDWPVLTRPACDVALTPDKKTVVAVDVTGEVKIGTIADRAVTKTFAAVTPTADGIAMLAMSQAGDKFAAIGADGQIRVFDLTGKLLREWALPVTVNTAAFAGTSLVTGNTDGTVYFLELP